jgi:hypothetical protein
MGSDYTFFGVCFVRRHTGFGGGIDFCVRSTRFATSLDAPRSLGVEND